VKSDELPPDVLAQWDAEDKLIIIPEASFCRANGFSSTPRDRYSIIHEVIHALEGHSGTLNRATNLGAVPRFAHKLRKLETWTERVTAAFIAPKHLIRANDTAETIAFRFGMSMQAAVIRLGEISPPQRGSRQVPDVIAKLLADLKRT
jgi:Zn-dependent peptidase ImmA (M78 family)